MPTRYFREKALLWSAFCILLFVNSLPASGKECAAHKIDEYASVTKIYDGDTLRLDDGRKLRFIGINTPELGHKDNPAEPLAFEARDRLIQLIPPGSQIGLVYGEQREDRHRRTLAHVFTRDNFNVSTALINEGLAFAIVVPPNDQYVECYFNAEQQARKQGEGIWSNSYYQPVESRSLPESTRGFKRVTGVITGIGKSKKNIWLDMGNNFSLKLARKHQHYFAKQPIEDLISKRVSVRGWVGYYNGKLRMSLNHPAMMEILQ
jgi:micrococcal nuclease